MDVGISPTYQGTNTGMIFIGDLRASLLVV